MLDLSCFTAYVTQQRHRVCKNGHKAAAHILQHGQHMHVMCNQLPKHSSRAKGICALLGCMHVVQALLLCHRSATLELQLTHVEGCLGCLVAEAGWQMLGLFLMSFDKLHGREM